MAERTKIELSDEEMQPSNEVRPSEESNEDEQPSSELGSSEESDADRQSGSELRPFERPHSLRTQEEYSDDDPEVPLKKSRNGKWWYATYHNVTAIVGSGVLCLPTAMVYLGWEGGIIVLVMSWVMTLNTLWQMVEMYEIKESNLRRTFSKKRGKKRSRTYYELGQKAFGDRLGLWIVLPQQLTVLIGTDIVYMVTAGQSLWVFYQLIKCNVSEKKHLDPVALGSGDQCCGDIGRATFTVFFALLMLLLAQLDGFNSIASISLGASLMSICYCIIASVESVRQGKVNHSSDFQLSRNSCSTSYEFHNDFGSEYEVLRAFSALGVVAFAYGGHNVVLEIQETLPSSPTKPSKGPMWQGVVVAYIIVALCYFPVAISGYWAFGNSLGRLGNTRKNPANTNILLQLGHPLRVIAAANIMVFIHVTGSYLVYAMPVFDLMEKVLVEKYHIIYLIENVFVKFRFQRPAQKRSILVMRLVTRSIYVCFTAFIAITFPFFRDLLAFFGGLAVIPTTYFMPCIIWLRLIKREYFPIMWFGNWACIIIGVLLMLCATLGGVWSIVTDASEYKFYQFRCNPKDNYNQNCPGGVFFT